MTNEFETNFARFNSRWKSTHFLGPCN